MADYLERYAAELFPRDYTSWRYCIEVKCRLALTPEFLRSRIAVLGDPRHQESQRFAKLYGDPYREQVLTWVQTRCRPDVMRVWRYRRYRLTGLILLLILGNSAPNAHPHHWVDVFAEWQFDQNGMISSLTLRWLFDDYYSVLLVDDTSTTQEELQPILDQILRNASSQNYFIQIEQHKGEEVQFGTPQQPRIDMQDHRIEIEFKLPLQVPMDPKRGNVIYRVSEPTYYFEMLHAEEGPAIVLKEAPPGCRYRLEPPTPDAALVAYAASLGVNESGGNDLGIEFAETVTIRCE